MMRGITIPVLLTPRPINCKWTTSPITAWKGHEQRMVEAICGNLPTEVAQDLQFSLQAFGAIALAARPTRILVLR